MSTPGTESKHKTYRELTEALCIYSLLWDYIVPNPVTLHLELVVNRETGPSEQAADIYLIVKMSQFWAASAISWH